LAIGASLFTVVAIVKYILDLKNSNVFIQEFNTAPYKYTFYNTDSMVKHYVKHGDETKCSSMEDYLYKANLVIIDKGNLSKLQKKDGDRIYYNTKTKEIVVVAKAGYVRTYFIASDKYYNKQ
jgi:pyocin large subunit-like protein